MKALNKILVPVDLSENSLQSIGEELIARDKDIPLLIVKDAHQRYDFFKAMGKL